MEKHRLSTMIAGLSLLVAIISVILPSVYAGDDEGTKKDLCKENEGDWEDGQCDFKTDDEDKTDRYLDDIQKIEDFEKERAAEEDALCDDPDAHFDICQSATLAFANKDKDELTQRDVDILCDASEDYEAHKEQCDKLYDKVQDATLAFVSSDGYDKEDCKADGGEWEDGECDHNCYLDGKKYENGKEDWGICD
jgi:hypothetical protein